MNGSDNKSGHPEALPQSWSLTEAVTWIVTGERLADEDMIRIQNEQKQEWKKKWGTVNGPQWRLDVLRVILSGEPVAEEDRPYVTETKQWLARTGQDAATAYKSAKVAADKLDLEKASYDRCYSLLWKLHEESGDAVWVVERYPNGHADNIHKPLPIGSIKGGENPLWHLWGEGLYGKACLVLGQKAGLAACPIYLDPHVSKAKVLELKRRFNEEQRLSPTKKDKDNHRAGDQELTKRITSVVSFARGRWVGGARRPTVHQMADLIIGQQKNKDFSKEALRQILSGRYRPMKRLGLKGLDG